MKRMGLKKGRRKEKEEDSVGREKGMKIVMMDYSNRIFQLTSKLKSMDWFG